MKFLHLQIHPLRIYYMNISAYTYIRIYVYIMNNDLIITSQAAKICMNFQIIWLYDTYVYACVHIFDSVSIHMYLQWNLCIMDTLGPTKGVQIIKVS